MDSSSNNLEDERDCVRSGRKRSRDDNGGSFGNNTGKNKKESNYRQRAPNQQHSHSLENFAHNKGQIRAWNDYKKRKQHEQLHKSKALRSYSKLLRREDKEKNTGIDGGIINSRRWKSKNKDNSKRPEGKDDEEDKEEAGDKVEETLQKQDDSNGTEGREEEDTKSSRKAEKTPFKKKSKSNPFQKSLAKAHQHQSDRELQDAQRQQNEIDRQQKLKQRRRTTKQLQQRTRKGQPVMKHAINNLLHKLQKQQEREE